MDIVSKIIGDPHNLTWINMGIRAMIIFIVSLILVRIAGRRTFALHAPLDNIIVLLLGSILARPIVGASEFVPTISAALVIVIMHRLLALHTVHSHIFNRFIKGEKTELFRHGKWNEYNLRYCGVSKDDIHEEIRLRTMKDSLEHIDIIYMERNGSMSIIERP